jgi:micrococcal nuclease
MKIPIFFILLFLPLFLFGQDLYNVNKQNISRSTEVNISLLTKAKVLRVIDGDTVQVEIFSPPVGILNLETIRLIGVDTPEIVDRRKPVQYFAKEASAFTKKTLSNNFVYLAFDHELRDKYNRLLVYLYLSNGYNFNALLLHNGYARVYTFFPFRFIDEFIAYEKAAKIGGRGLWK